MACSNSELHVMNQQHLVGLLGRVISPRRKVSTYAGPHSTETQRQTPMPCGIRTHNPSNRTSKTYALRLRGHRTSISTIQHSEIGYPLPPV
jgi:hypothetical protein